MGQLSFFFGNSLIFWERRPEANLEAVVEGGTRIEAQETFIFLGVWSRRDLFSAFSVGSARINKRSYFFLF